MAQHTVRPADTPGDEQLTVFGQCLSPRQALLDCFRRGAETGDLTPLLKLEDNFVACYEAGTSVWIVNSIYSLNSYFYATHTGQFAHGDTIKKVAALAPVDLRWNLEAIGDLLAFGHLIGDETLARGVRPVPQGTVIHWDGASMTVRASSHGSLSVAPPHRASPDSLIDLFLSGLKAGVGARAITTASSGLDSRVNIAGLLHLGLRPELCVMGDSASKDVQIVQQIGRAFNLPVNHIDLDARGYIFNAKQIANITNGVKPLDHWHTFLLARNSGYRLDDRVVTGNNGEHVRAVGFDYGFLSHSLDALSHVDRQAITGPLLSRYWQMKTHIILRPEELRQCSDGLATYYGSNAQNRKVLTAMPNDKTFVWRNDAFVLGERRRGFQACGLKLMSLGFSPFSAFMRKSWIDAGWSLPLSWRLGSRWHRYAVERLCPQLLTFPEESETHRMLRRQRPLSWVPYLKKIYRRPRAMPYMNYRELMMRKDIVGLLYEHASALAEIMPPSLVKSIADEQLRTGERGKLLATLTGMAIWRASLQEGGGPEVAARTQPA